jgi:hypothetical protein
MNKEDITKCETCKCLIAKEDAIRGKSVIRERKYFNQCYYPSYREEIYTPYYCHKCKKEKK